MAKRMRRELHAMTQQLGAGKVDLMEVFCPGSFSAKASAFDLRPGLAYDLRNGWNLSDPKQVEKAWAGSRPGRRW